jgi:hypothetical protein
VSEEKNPYKIDTAEAYLWGVVSAARQSAIQHLKQAEEHRLFACAAAERADKYEAALQKLVQK